MVVDGAMSAVSIEQQRGKGGPVTAHIRKAAVKPLMVTPLSSDEIVSPAILEKPTYSITEIKQYITAVRRFCPLFSVSENEYKTPVSTLTNDQIDALLKNNKTKFNAEKPHIVELELAALVLEKVLRAQKIKKESVTKRQLDIFLRAIFENKKVGVDASVGDQAVVNQLLEEWNNMVGETQAVKINFSAQASAILTSRQITRQLARVQRRESAEEAHVRAIKAAIKTQGDKNIVIMATPAVRMQLGGCGAKVTIVGLRETLPEGVDRHVIVTGMTSVEEDEELEEALGNQDTVQHLFSEREFRSRYQHNVPGEARFQTKAGVGVVQRIKHQLDEFKARLTYGKITDQPLEKQENDLQQYAKHLLEEYEQRWFKAKDRKVALRELKKFLTGDSNDTNSLMSELNTLSVGAARQDHNHDKAISCWAPSFYRNTKGSRLQAMLHNIQTKAWETLQEQQQLTKEAFIASQKNYLADLLDQLTQKLDLPKLASIKAIANFDGVKNMRDLTVESVSIVNTVLQQLNSFKNTVLDAKPSLTSSQTALMKFLDLVVQRFTSFQVALEACPAQERSRASSLSSDGSEAVSVDSLAPVSP